MLPIISEPFTFSSAVYKRKFKKCQDIIVLPVMHGYETWSLMFKEEQRLRMIENRVPRRMFGPRRDPEIKY
jgi:hypothetical protein